MRYVIAAFIALHGLVHLLYFGHSRRLFELRPEMAWPDRSWVFSKLLGAEGIRMLASIYCALATIGFLAGGTAILASQAWWRPVVVGSGFFSAIVFILFWDGKMEKLDDQGGFALFINIVILAAMLILGWPNFEF